MMHLMQDLAVVLAFTDNALNLKRVQQFCYFQKRIWFSYLAISSESITENTDFPL